MIMDIVERLRLEAEQESEASEMMAKAKSLRQGHNPPRGDLYSWSTKEQTTRWRAADTIQSLRAELDRVKADNVALREGLENVLDPDDCWLDHNGNCQAHFITNPCEAAQARALLERTSNEAK
ncbi:MAG: hypothetical protein ACRCVX_12605 [Shewanella sp.]